MRRVTSPPGSTGASTTHGIPPLATPPPDRRNALQFVGRPRPAPAVDCSDSNPNLQAAPDFSPDPGYDTDAVPRWVRKLHNELSGYEEENGNEEEDRCELPLCAPRLLTIMAVTTAIILRVGSGCMCAHVCMHNWMPALVSRTFGRSLLISQLCGKAA